MTEQDKKSIREYLDQVRRHSGNRGPAEQQELVRALEEHIHEIINAKPGSQEPVDVKAILLEMDPPESFGTPTDQEDSERSGEFRRMSLGKLSLVVLIAAVTTPFLLMAIGQLVRGTIGSIATVGIPLGIVLLVVALSLGIAARKERAGKATIIASAIILASLAVFVPVNMVFWTGGEETGESMQIIESEPAGEPAQPSTE